MQHNIPTPLCEHGAAYHTDRPLKFLVTEVAYTNGTQTREGVSLHPDNVQHVDYIFKLPEGYVSLIGCDVIMHRGAAVPAADVVLDLQIYAGEIGEPWFAEDNSDDNNVVTIPADGDQAAFASDHGTLFTGVTKDHYIFFKVERDAVHASDTYPAGVIVSGVEIEYTADM